MRLDAACPAGPGALPLTAPGFGALLPWRRAKLSRFASGLLPGARQTAFAALSFIPLRAISSSGGAVAGSARSRSRDSSLENPFCCRAKATAPQLLYDSRAAPTCGPSGGPRALSYQKRNLEPSPLSYRGEGSAALPRQLWQPILSATRGPSGGLRSLSHQKRNPEPPPLSCRGGRFGRSLAAALAAGTAGRGSSGNRYYRRASLNSSSLAVPEASRRFAASAPALPRGMTGTPVCS